ncbi:hypothetical protein A6B35_31240 (plasmid) [Mesorhizobium amorphae CCNWGS0123]|nr:hypothetical protein A6B35_31240 [Mesorhizobium amorphae CCNWGS0123]
MVSWRALADTGRPFAIAWRNCRLGEIILADDIGGTGAYLPCRQQSIPDQANNGHVADAEAACCFA